MTIQEFEAMLTTITKERMGEVLTMKMPEDKSSVLADSISTLTQRVDNIEQSEKEKKVEETAKNSAQASEDYFNELLK